MFDANTTPEEFADQMNVPTEKRADFIKQINRMEIAIRMEGEFPIIATQIEKRYTEFKDNHPEATEDETDAFMQNLLDDAKALTENPFFAALLANESREYADWVKESYLQMSSESAKDLSVRMLQDRVKRNRYRRVSSVFAAMAQIEHHLDLLGSQN